MRALSRKREFWLFGAIVLLMLVISIRAPGFVAPASLRNIFNDTSMLIMLALAQMCVILTRSIDLSVAANLAFSGMVTALLNVAYPGLPIPLLVLAAMGCGALLGALNGLLVWKLNIPPIVVTLGTLTIYRGMIYVIAGGAWVSSVQMSDAYKLLPRAEVLGVSLLSWSAVVVILIVYWMLTRTPIGRAFYASGINPTAAVYAGVNVGLVRFVAFCVAGLISGLCGILWVTRYTVANVQIATGFELSVIASCVIGGVSIAGGVGTVIGAVLGALFIGVINNALPVVNLSPFWQMAISGSAILLAVIFNSSADRKRGRMILKRATAR